MVLTTLATLRPLTASDRRRGPGTLVSPGARHQRLTRAASGHLSEPPEPVKRPNRGALGRDRLGLVRLACLAGYVAGALGRREAHDLQVLRGQESDQDAVLTVIPGDTGNHSHLKRRAASCGLASGRRRLTTRRCGLDTRRRGLSTSRVSLSTSSRRLSNRRRLAARSGRH